MSFISAKRRARRFISHWVHGAAASCNIDRTRSESISHRPGWPQECSEEVRLRLEPTGVAVASGGTARSGSSRAGRRGAPAQSRRACSHARARLLRDLCARADRVQQEVPTEFAARRLDARRCTKTVARVLPQAAEPWPPTGWDRAACSRSRWPKRLARRRARRSESALAHEITAGESPNPTLGLQGEYADASPNIGCTESASISCCHVAASRVDAELARARYGRHSRRVDGENMGRAPRARRSVQSIAKVPCAGSTC